MNRQPGGTASARTAGTLLGEYTEGRQFVGWRGPVSATRRCRKPCAETPRCFTWNAAQMRARGRGPGRGAGMPGTRAAATRRGERPALFHVKRGRVRGGGRRARFGPKLQPGPGSARRPGPRHEATRRRFEAAKRGDGPRGRGSRRHGATRHEASRSVQPHGRRRYAPAKARLSPSCPGVERGRNGRLGA